uniref:Uncharacterized protein n=1 Tax=Rhizophora mucronata TaxID=61149 RepID=A0A2P2L5B8_RHIMU
MGNQVIWTCPSLTSHHMESALESIPDPHGKESALETSCSHHDHNHLDIYHDHHDGLHKLMQ